MQYIVDWRIDCLRNIVVFRSKFDLKLNRAERSDVLIHHKRVLFIARSVFSIDEEGNLKTASQNEKIQLAKTSGPKIGGGGGCDGEWVHCIGISILYSVASSSKTSITHYYLIRGAGREERLPTRPSPGEVTEVVFLGMAHWTNNFLLKMIGKKCQ